MPRGRPPLDPNSPGNRAPLVGVHFPRPTIARLDAEAARRGLKRSVVVRSVIEDWLAEQEQERTTA